MPYSQVALRLADTKKPTAFPEFTPPFSASTGCHQRDSNGELTWCFKTGHLQTGVCSPENSPVQVTC